MMKNTGTEIKKMRWIYACCFWVCALVNLTACIFDSNKDLLLYIETVKKRVYPKKIPPIPAMPVVDNFVFPENDARRNPFYPESSAKNKDVIAPDQHRKRQALEAYSLDALQFVGILEEGSTIWALIKIPGENAQIVRVKVGNYMGKNFGKIVQITDKLIKLEELYQVEGGWKRKETVILLHGAGQ